MNLQAFFRPNKSVYKITAFTFVVTAALLATPFEAEAKKKNPSKGRASKAQIQKSQSKAKGKKTAKSQAKAAPSCRKDFASSTTYFVPHIKDYCSPALKPCASFKEEVKLQGSGTLVNNKIFNYLGQTRDIGSCETAIGAAGVCLTPFISVAADPRYYNMGDIIAMPGLKGRKITLPNGKTMVHPGYFIVQDVGSAIKGPNRFDFFTGSLSPKDDGNAFGYDGFQDLVMNDKNNCNKEKQFFVIKLDKPGYEVALNLIDDAKVGMSANRSYASVQTSRSGYMRGTN